MKEIPEYYNLQFFPSNILNQTCLKLIIRRESSMPTNIWREDIEKEKRMTRPLWFWAVLGSKSHYASIRAIKEHLTLRPYNNDISNIYYVVSDVYTL